jgi:hypothetical protein
MFIIFYKVPKFIIFFPDPYFKDFVIFIGTSNLASEKATVRFWTLYHENHSRKM